MTRRAAKNNTNLWPTIFSILALLAAGELICRSLDMYDGWKTYHKLLGQTVSYREQSYSVSKPQGVLRVILLGGSAVHDTVKDYHESWPYLLELKLREETGKKVEVINMGFYTESSIDELFKLHEFGLELSPDLVIVFDGENDVYNIFHHYDYWKRLYELKAKIILREKKHSIFTRIYKGMMKKSALYQRINRVKKGITAELTARALESREQGPSGAAGGAEGGEKDKAAPAQPDQMAGVGAGPQGEQFFEDESRWPEIHASYLEIYGSNLEKMAKLIRRVHARGLFIFQPDLSYKPLLTGAVTDAERNEYLKTIGNHDALWKKIQKENYPEGTAIMKNTAEKYGLSFHDFNQRILPGADVHDFFDGSVHLSPKGREKIVNEIASIIKEEKLL